MTRRTAKLVFTLIVALTVIILERLDVFPIQVNENMPASVSDSMTDTGNTSSTTFRTAKVMRVIDGDTVELEGGERLRYIGIDTPELHDPRKPVQCFAREAMEKNRELVEGKFITYQKDINERDKFGRLLGYVYLQDGTLVNLELVKNGYAFSYPYVPDISKRNEFEKAEEEARNSKIGLWGGCVVQ